MMGSSSFYSSTLDRAKASMHSRVTKKSYDQYKLRICRTHWQAYLLRLMLLDLDASVTNGGIAYYRLNILRKAVEARHASSMPRTMKREIV